MALEAKIDIIPDDISRMTREIFEVTLKEVFTNPTSYEETEFHHFCIVKVKDQEGIYYDDVLLSEDVFQDKMAAGYKSLIKSYIQNTLKKYNYVLEESEIFIDKNGHWIKVFWVFFSECLDSNYGKLLLKCVFQKLSVVWNQYWKEKVGGVDRSDTGKSGSEYIGIAQRILQGAEAQTALYIQKMFAPFNIDFIDCLSGEYYEKSACESNLIFLSETAAKCLSAEDLLFCFQGIEFIPMNSRLIRKLLQIAQNNLYLVLKADEQESIFHVAGICTESVLFQILKKEDKITVPYIRVNVKKYMQWDIFLGDIYMFTSRNGHYKVERELQEEFMIKKIQAYFGGTRENYKELFRNIQKSTKQTHGTMLVIMDSETAYNETQRLGTKQYGLSAFDDPATAERMSDKKELIQQEINNLNAIDGCIIFGIDGNLYGIGMILDGIAREKGSLARGARYNSAIKYLSYLSEGNKKAMILVISEDGSVDICTTDDVKGKNKYD